MFTRMRDFTQFSLKRIQRVKQSGRPGVARLEGGKGPKKPSPLTLSLYEPNHTIIHWVDLPLFDSLRQPWQQPAHHV